MTYKTILVHLNSAARARAVLAVACDIANHFEAHMIGLTVSRVGSVGPAVALPFGTDVSSRLRQIAKDETHKLRSIFDEATSRQAFIAEWRQIEPGRSGALATLLDHAHAADLIIAGQNDPGQQYSNPVDFPERIALGAGRPVLVVPRFGDHTGMPEKVTVAWSNRREAARAVADSMPFLQAAKQVHLLTVAEYGSGEPDALPDTEMEAALARHGVNVTASRVVATDYTIGEEIRIRAVGQDADLLILGCYGHSRLREVAFGGVTRHMLRDMTHPMLFSH